MASLTNSAPRHFADGTVAIYPERLIKRGLRPTRARPTTVRLDLRMDAALADRLDAAATAAGESIDQYIARVLSRHADVGGRS